MTSPNMLYMVQAVINDSKMEYAVTVIIRISLEMTTLSIVYSTAHCQVNPSQHRQSYVCTCNNIIESNSNGTADSYLELMYIIIILCDGNNC
jgi:hypothetical protein